MLLYVALCWWVLSLSHEPATENQFCNFHTSVWRPIASLQLILKCSGKFTKSMLRRQPQTIWLIYPARGYHNVTLVELNYCGFCFSFHFLSVPASLHPEADMTSHISPMYIGIYAMWAIRGPIKSSVFERWAIPGFSNWMNISLNWIQPNSKFSISDKMPYFNLFWTLWGDFLGIFRALFWFDQYQWFPEYWIELSFELNCQSLFGIE